MHDAKCDGCLDDLNIFDAYIYTVPRCLMDKTCRHVHCSKCVKDRCCGAGPSVKIFDDRQCVACKEPGTTTLTRP